MENDTRKPGESEENGDEEKQMAPLPPPDRPSNVQPVKVCPPPTTESNLDNSLTPDQRKKTTRGRGATKFGSNAVALSGGTASHRHGREDRGDGNDDVPIESHVGAFAVRHGISRARRMKITGEFLRSSQASPMDVNSPFPAVDSTTAALENSECTQPVPGDDHLDGSSPIQNRRDLYQLLIILVVVVGILGITLPLTLRNDDTDGLLSPSAANASIDQYVDCTVENPSWIGNGVCDGGPYMREECGYDGGDCLEFLNTYPNCTVTDISWIGDGGCDGEPYMTEECGFDGGDCLLFMEKYPDCYVAFPSFIGDGICNGGPYITEHCGYDGGDCLEFLEKYPNCTAEYPFWIGDGVCNSFAPYVTEECDFDGGDCDVYRDYPTCNAQNLYLIGDGICNGGSYMTEECGFDGGDCLLFMETYPDCNMTEFSSIGDGVCDGGSYMTEECGFDGGDCLEFFQIYPNCIVEYPIWIGDGECDGDLYNKSECDYDGGDCLL